MTSAPDIGFDYRPSRWPQVWLSVIGALALIALWLSALSWPLAVATSVLALLYVSISLRSMRRAPVRSALWRADGGWQLRLSGGREVEATLAGHRVLAGGVILRLGWAPGRQAVLTLFGDNLDADTRRRLRMRLSASSDTR